MLTQKNVLFKKSFVHSHCLRLALKILFVSDIKIVGGVKYFLVCCSVDPQSYYLLLSVK